MEIIHKAVQCEAASENGTSITYQRNGKYSVYGVILPTDKGQESVIKELLVMLPSLLGSGEFIMKDKDISVMNGMSLKAKSADETKQKRKRMSYPPVIRSLLTLAVNRKNIKSKQDYQHLGVPDYPGHQTLHYIPIIQELQQTSG